MKIKDFSDINPQPSSPIHERPFIDYIDTSSVENGVFTGAEHMTNSFPSRAQREIKTGDILISSVRPNLRHNYFVKKSEHGMIVSSGFIHIRVLDLQKVSPLFLYYFLTSPTQVHRYEKVAESSQSAYPSFNKSLIEETDFPDISLPVQLRIAGLRKLLNWRRWRNLSTSVGLSSLSIQTLTDGRTSPMAARWFGMKR